MISTLYKNFQHWSDGGSVYIISDTHFNDSDMDWRLDKIKSLTNRSDLTPNFIPIYIIRQINKVCKINDTLICLGDVGDLSFFKGISCKTKILITGNHDRGVSKYYDDNLFQEVYDGPLFISSKIVLSHEPINLPYALNIHGHDHSFFNYIDSYDKTFSNSNFPKWMLENKLLNTNTVNVCCECVDFTPVNLKDIINSEVHASVNTIHRITIDDATIRRNNNVK